jgi:curved DNA-binding protein CbpA
MTRAPLDRRDLPEPSAGGTLEKRPFAHLLLYALERRLSGTIDLAGPGGEARVVFSEGHPTKVAAVGLTVGARLEAIFRFPDETVFAYFHAVDGLMDDAPTPLHPLPFVWRGIRSAAPSAHVHAVLARVDGARVKLVETFDPVELGLGPIEIALLDPLCAGPVDVAALLSNDLVELADVQRLLYFLVITKRVSVIDEAGDVVTATPVDGPRSTPSALPPPVFFPSTYPRPSYTDESGPPPSVVPARMEAARAEFERPSSPPPSVRSGTRPSSAAVAHELLLALEIRRKAIGERAAQLDGEDDYEVLGVPPRAGPEEIRKAYAALAKAWHPERLPPGLANMQRTVSRVFMRMTEAHERLVDPARRVAYARQLGTDATGGEPAAARPLEAATAFGLATLQLKRGNVVEAEAECRRALALDDAPPDHTALLLWLEALKPVHHDPGATTGYIDRLAALIARHPACERALYYRGMLYKRLGEHPYAMSDFNKVHALNPDDIDAQREIRVYNSRGVKSIPPGRRVTSAPAGKSVRPSAEHGLLGKLLKK